MPVERFTRAEFEHALPATWSYRGVVDGEHTYSIPVRTPPTLEPLHIMIRSSVKDDGYSAATGEDSIRLWLADKGGKPVAGKLTKYITRVPGWQARLLVQLRTLYKIGLALTPCPRCGVLRHAFKVQGRGKGNTVNPENVGKLFQRCVNPAGRVEGNRRLSGCVDSFAWIVFKESR